MQQGGSLELQIAEHKRSHYGCEFCAIVAIFFLGILTLTLPWAHVQFQGDKHSGSSRLLPCPRDTFQLHPAVGLCETQSPSSTKNCIKWNEDDWGEYDKVGGDTAFDRGADRLWPVVIAFSSLALFATTLALIFLMVISCLFYTTPRGTFFIAGALIFVSAASAFISWIISLFSEQFQADSYEQVFDCKRVTVTIAGGFWASVLVAGLSFLVWVAFLTTIALSGNKLEAAHSRISNNVVTRRRTIFEKMMPLSFVVPPTAEAAEMEGADRLPGPLPFPETRPGIVPAA